jgi:hypothetical protein
MRSFVQILACQHAASLELEVEEALLISLAVWVYITRITILMFCFVFSALQLPTGKTTVMHLVSRENLPEPNNQGTP